MNATEHVYPRSMLSADLRRRRKRLMIETLGVAALFGCVMGWLIFEALKAGGWL